MMSTFLISDIHTFDLVMSETSRLIVFFFFVIAERTSKILRLVSPDDELCELDDDVELDDGILKDA